MTDPASDHLHQSLFPSAETTLWLSQYLTEAVGTHGHDGHPHEDVETGHQDADQVRVAVESHPDGHQQREGVDQAVHEADPVHLGHGDGAEAEVEEDDDQAHPAWDTPRPWHRLPALDRVWVKAPGVSGSAAKQPGVESLEVAAKESAHKADVEQEDRQPDTGNPHGQKFAKTGLRTLIRITWKRRNLLEFAIL